MSSTISFCCALAECGKKIVNLNADEYAQWCAHCYSHCYCSSAHQKKDWTVHKTCCRVLPYILRVQFREKRALCIQPLGLNNQHDECIARSSFGPGKTLLQECFGDRSRTKTEKNERLVSGRFIENDSPSLLRACKEIADCLLTKHSYQEWWLYLTHYYRLNGLPTDLLKWKQLLIETQPRLWNLLNTSISDWNNIKEPINWHKSAQDASSTSSIESIIVVTMIVVIQNIMVQRDTSKEASELENEDGKLRLTLEMVLGAGVFNHSCRPEIVLVKSSQLSTEEEFRFVTQEEISQGQVLRLSYRPERLSCLNQITRRFELLNECYFLCECRWCQIDDKESNEHEETLHSTLKDVNVDQKELYQEYQKVALSCGLSKDHEFLANCDDMKIIWKHCVDVQQFQNKFKLDKWHWCSHTLRMWMMRALWKCWRRTVKPTITSEQRKNDRYLNLLRQWALHSVECNARLMKPMAMLKMDAFEMFIAVSHELRLKEDEAIQKELNQYDQSYGRWAAIWMIANETV